MGNKKIERERERERERKRLVVVYGMRDERIIVRGSRLF